MIRLGQSLSILTSKTLFGQVSTRAMATKAKQSRFASDTKENRIVWVDLEMSGLDVEKEHILEMACLITDSDLNIVAESEDIVINQPAHVLDNMGDWCKEHHGQSGLTAAVLNSKISLKDAESRMLKFVQEHTTKGTSPLAGNSVYMDRLFLMKYMPTFTDHLHYRLVDVSTLKELCKRWYPDKLKHAPKKKLSHRALDDIKESIEELKFFKSSIFVPS